VKFKEIVNGHVFKVGCSIRNSGDKREIPFFMDTSEKLDFKNSEGNKTSE